MWFQLEINLPKSNTNNKLFPQVLLTFELLKIDLVLALAGHLFD